jgi:tryptophan 2,3-dioxygenase
MADRSDDSEVTYSTYLAVDDLLALQRPRSRPEHPDELLFIVVHQTSELWFKVLLHELDALVDRMKAGETLAAVVVTRRLNALVRIVAAQLTALDTLPPQRFAQFRGYLGSASGGQSAQFRAIEAVSGLRDDHFLQVLREHGEIPALVRQALDRPTLQSLFLDLLRRHGVSLDSVYAAPSPSPFFLLAEGLIEYEQGFQLWRYLHVQLVERIIGPHTGGTGGTLGARYLQRTLQQRFFPELRDVRARFFTGELPAPAPSGVGHA